MVNVIDLGTYVYGDTGTDTMEIQNGDLTPPIELFP